MPFRLACPVAVIVTVIAAPISAQGVPVTNLSAPNVTFSHGFTDVGGVRELSDGRVIVLDVANRTVHVIDSAWVSMRQIGREGAGPEEYSNPTKLFAIPRDSSIAFDTYHRRMLVITPDAMPGGFLYPMGRTSGNYSLAFTSSGLLLMPAEASDGRGYFYARGQRVAEDANGELVLADSAPIERWAFQSPKRDTVGFIPVELVPGCELSLPVGMVLCPLRGNLPRIPAFRTAPQWAVGPDGRVAVVTPDPYRVKFFTAAGEEVVGMPIPYTRLRVARAHKQQWRARRQQRRVMVVVDEYGGSRTAGHTQRLTEPDWPAFLPPFLRGAAHFDSNGVLWVQRTTPAGESPLFDMIDESGRVVMQVRVPDRRRLVGFGDGSVYLVQVDEVDLQYLERYQLPTIGGP